MILEVHELARMHYQKDIIISEAAFMLYNYARLCSIFDHFEQCVQQGDVAPLPPVEDVDFALLRHDVRLFLFYTYG